MCQPSGCPRCNPSYRRGLAAITALEAATIAPEERKLRVSVTTAHSPTRSYREGGAGVRDVGAAAEQRAGGGISP